MTDEQAKRRMALWKQHAEDVPHPLSWESFKRIWSVKYDLTHCGDAEILRAAQRCAKVRHTREYTNFDEVVAHEVAHTVFARVSRNVCGS